MMNFKNHKGSLLLEAVFALCIASLLLIPLFNSLSILITRIGFNNQKITAFFYAKQFLQTILLQKQISSEKNIIQKKIDTQKLENETILTYFEQPTHEKSIFKNHYLLKITVAYTWKSLLKDGSDSITTYVIKIPQEKE